MRSPAVFAVIVFAVCPLPGRAAGVDVRQALATTQQYLAQWEATLIALVADERYEQVVTGLGWGGTRPGTRDGAG